MTTVLSLKNICKSFGPVEVLKNVDFELERGEVRALLGANGAGKSTLIKIIGGVIAKSAGEMYLRGESAEVLSPIDAQEKGISIIHQELSVIPQLTVLENFFLGRELTQGIKLDQANMVRRYNEICDEMGFDIPWNTKVKNLSIAKRQMVEIMKAVSYDAELIIMDEPTTSLTEHEKATLFKIIRQLKEKQKTVVYISHMLEEIFEVCDKVTIMLGGEVVGNYPVADLTQHRIAELMAGKTLAQGHVQRVSHVDYSKKPVLEVKGLTRTGKFEEISFDVYPGEILGMAGLVGAGRSEIVRAIFGADGHTGGEILLNGKPCAIKSPADAIENGIGLIPEDRKTQGLILKHEIYKNATLLCLNNMKKHGFLNKGLELDYTDKAVKQLTIKVSDIHNRVQSLSGGNQQKIVVSKWLGKDLRVLIFDEPTKGIDVRAKEDIFATAEQFAKNGVAVIFISSDLEEVLRVSDRVVMIHGGKLVKTRVNEDLTVASLMQDILIKQQ
ncbi:sugar ABC transporter ATP-binding protein [Oscillospiraceae bacterium PP1C4]